MTWEMTASLLAGTAAAMLAWLEGTRRNSHRRGLRLLLVGILAGALAAMGIRSRDPISRGADRSAAVTLVTEGAPAISGEDGRLVALATAMPAGGQWPVASDAAQVLRTMPEVREIRVAGIGVTQADAAALAGKRVVRVGTTAPSGHPQLGALAVPATVVLGDPLRIQGRVRGLSPGEAISVAVEAPDGTVRTSEVVAGADGAVGFTADGGVPVAPGLFEWRLRLGSRGEPVAVGVRVVAPALPRVLFWEGAPSTESARLRRWLGEVGVMPAARIQVSADRVRTTGMTVSGTVRLTAELLADHDVLVCDPETWRALSAAERAVLDHAVADGGLGVIVTGPWIQSAARSDSPFPWTFADSPEAESVADGEAVRRVRLRLSDGTLLEEPVEAAPLSLLDSIDGQRLAVDPLDRTLAASYSRGRGRIAVVLVENSWRWLQQGHARSFARFWTHVLSAVARPAPAAAEWQLLRGGESLFVDHPVAFAFTGSGDPPAEPPAARQVGGSDPAVALAYRERGVAVTWPRNPGWHQLVDSRGAVVQAYFVQTPQALPGVRERVRTELTDRLVVDSPTHSDGTERAVPSSGLPLGWLFLLAVAAAGLLWVDERWRRIG